MEMRLKSKGWEEPDWVLSDVQTDHFITLLRFAQDGGYGTSSVYSRFDLGKRMFIDDIPSEIELPEDIDEQIANEIGASLPDYGEPRSKIRQQKG